MAEENRWWGAFGLPQPEETGEKGQEPAAPVGSTEDTGAKEQEVTEPADTVTETSADAAVPAGQEETSNETEPEKGSDKKQSAEERRKQAEQRRERERRETEQRIREEEAQKSDQRMKDVFSSLGLKDGNGNPVETMEQFEAMQAQQRARRVQKDLKAGNLTQEALREAVLEAPEVKQVLQQAQTATIAAQEAQRKANNASYAANMQQELALIQKLDPSIKSTDDIIRMETGPEYARLLRVGLRPSEAYRLANFDKIRSRDRSAAEQAARNATAGKNHVQGTPTPGKQPLAVPEDYKQNMRRFVRGISDEEIEKSYRKYHKND